MKLLFTFLLSLTFLAAGEYLARVEPFETVTLGAEASGLVVAVDLSKEGTATAAPVIRIDQRLEREQKALALEKREILKAQLAIREEQEAAYNTIAGKSRFDRDEKSLAVLTLKSQLAELESAVAGYDDLLRKKTATGRGMHVKEILVREGAYVTPGTPLMTLESPDKRRLVLYVDREDRRAIEKRPILVNGAKAHPFTLRTAARTPDATYLSSYKVELEAPGSEGLGEMVTVTFGAPE